MVSVLEQDSCGNCVFYMVATRVCRRLPPHPIMVGVKQGLAGIQPEPVVMSYFPSMMPTGWCGEYTQMETPTSKDN